MVRFNCDFEEGEECLWTWENDSFEGSKPAYRDQSWPGQHGFSRLNGFDVQRLFNRSKQIENAMFFGPHKDNRGRSDGHFLYLLGHPISSEEPVTDKRLISSPIKESGTECSLEMTLFYQGIRGAEVVVGTQNLYKAYSVSSRHVFQDNNATTHGRWAHMKMRIGRYLKPFSVSIEIKRHQASKPGSFIAMDAVVLDKCTPESSMPIDCSSSPREYYVCPDAQGVPCMPAASVLCDLHRDCPGGHDEDDPICDAMPLGSQCDFDENDSLCGWEVYSQSIDHQFSHENREWSLRNGGTKLGGITEQHQGNYLYLEYNGSRVGNFQTAMLRSPTFPPQPKYNANATSRYFESCRIRLSYHVMSESITPGFLDLYVHYKNDSSLDGSEIEHKLTRVTTDELMMDHYGWKRWEAVIPPMPQLRYNIFLVGSNGLGTRNEMAVDNITLSPQCFGLGVPQEELQGWRPSMTDKEFCQHYNRTQCSRPEKSEEYLFNSCKARRGAIGPTQKHCDDAYSKSNTKVLIGDPGKTKDDVHIFGYVTGIQRWKVPKTKMYSFIVSGASGAVGRRNRLESRADEIRAIMWLEANETVFILVGQQGNSYCPVNSIIIAEGRCDGTLGTLGSDRKKRYLMNDDRHMDNSHSHPRSPKKSADVRTIARIMSSTDNKHLNSGYVETPESEISDQTHHGQVIKNEPLNATHLNANDNIEMVRTESKKKVTYEGGGGGGGATIIFRIRNNHTVEPLFIAAGGGGASDHQSEQYGSPSVNPDAKGYVHLKAKLQDLMALVSKRDMDAGSGGGWNRTLSVPIKFEEVFEAFEKGLRVNPAGFSSDNSWMGGLRCSPKSHQYGGFGGGGAGCKGGGGGGGFVGGKGGDNDTQNGEGGWSYFNSEAVVKILSPSSAFRNAPARGDIPSTWKHRGAGQVQIIEALPDRYCHTNCSSFGAVCMTFDPEEDIRGCVCPNGIILTHSGLCSDEIPMYAVIAYAIGCCLAFIMVAFCCRVLYMQYQRQHSKDLRRKMLASNGGGPDSQLHRIRAMTGMNGNGDMLLTEYNPNYEFGGGTFTLQDLLEIPRENLRIVNRDTSASSGSGGRGVDTSAESGSGFSLPMRNQRTSSVPDSPSTLNGNGTSSDYLVPTNGSASSKRPSFRSQSQSIESSMEAEAQPVQRVGRNGNPIELETSFTKSPRRSDGYSTLPQVDKQPDPVQHMELQKGRISNRAYGLSGVREPHTQRMMSGSKSTQPLLDDDTSPPLSPEHPQPNGHSSSVINPSFQGDRDLANCPLGPLPPTPTDPTSSDAQTPSSHQSLSLDVNSLRGQNPAPLSMSRNAGYSSGPSVHVRDKYPYTIPSASKEEPKNEISV
eukprot:TCALIF_00190-PA protein Name:"Similar to ALK ALK tyrosine kinase receptor (Homo sapiens)" AED:0.10 eAED:0.10 QI:0/0.88/0.72/0.94/0.88/0.94/18/0/1347